MKKFLSALSLAALLGASIPALADNVLPTGNANASVAASASTKAPMKKVHKHHKKHVKKAPVTATTTPAAPVSTK